MSALPEYVRQCDACDGAGRREQNYTAGCGSGMYQAVGRCDLCAGTGYVYRGSGAPVGQSVVNQILIAGDER